MPKSPRPSDEALHTEYWRLRRKGHGIIGAQNVLVDKYEGVSFGKALDAITHPKVEER